jgi:class 3 adenylate cyclase
MSAKPTVVVVDDEPAVLTSVRDQIRHALGAGFAVEEASGGTDALELLDDLATEGVSVPCVVSDQLMPGMTGDQLLATVHERMPETRTVMLTGQADAHAVGHAVNAAQLFRFLAKPWSAQDLVMTVREACKSHEQALSILRHREELERVNAELRRFNEDLEGQVLARTADLARAHAESERLLLNILPPAIARRLKAGERAIADRFDAAAVLFADVVGFTPRSSTMAPEEVVRVLDALFLAFDAKLVEHGVEKVKTIGDAYMAVAGVPAPCADAAIRIARFALAARDAAEGTLWPDGSPIRLRFGMHVGPLVAGVVGASKTVYDLWGDTVNVASRMESHSEPGRLHVSSAFAAAIGDAFSIEPRGLVEVKGVGSVDTFWLTP